MAYYQVLIAVKQEPDGLSQVFEDLDENQLKTKLLIPYEGGTSLICGNDIILVLQIRKIHIVQTAQRNKIERENLYRKSVLGMDRLNREFMWITISLGSVYDPADILEAGKDATSKYINAPQEL